jgi:hypothetical protein
MGSIREALDSKIRLSHRRRIETVLPRSSQKTLDFRCAMPPYCESIATPGQRVPNCRFRIKVPRTCENGTCMRNTPMPTWPLTEGQSFSANRLAADTYQNPSGYPDPVASRLWRAVNSPFEALVSRPPVWSNKAFEGSGIGDKAWTFKPDAIDCARP